jgi:mxaK protein
MAGLKRWINPLVWSLLIAALGAAAWSAYRLLQLHAINRAIAEGVGALPADSTDARVRYAAGWQAERSLHFTDAVQLYTDAQAADDPARAAQAWFALGNVYFKVGIAESREYEAKVGALFENAQFDLARDAYRSALRIEPDLAGARYNLELLERLSPAKHLQGWLRNTDPIMLVPERHHGWTSMQDDRKRGLP